MNGVLKFSALLVHILANIQMTHQAEELEPITETLYGMLRGRRNKSLDKHVDSFIGIPYADPPIGSLRFAPPRPALIHWEGIRNATEFSPACWQRPDVVLGNFTGTASWNGKRPYSEDCLYLNVWTPYPRHKEKLPVMVWIHGGSFVSGSGSLEIYDGATLAANEQVVLVTLNYRLVVLGFLAFERTDSPGNVGLMDQSLALQWVKDNIEYFGGASDKVTIFGSSAGATSVGYHLLSPFSRNLFKRAVLQSGSPQMPFLTPESYRVHMYLAKCFALEMGCLSIEQVSYRFNETAVLECLRSKPAESLMNSNTNIHFPVEDRNFIPAQPKELLDTEKMKKTELLIGTNENEGMFNLIRLAPGFNLNDESHLTSKQFREIIHFRFSESPDSIIDEIQTEYTTECGSVGPSSSSCLRDLIDDVWGDYDIKCPLVEFGDYYSSAGMDVYVYQFQHRSATNPWPDWAGIVHEDEIEFIFGAPLHRKDDFSTKDSEMSKKTMKFWANFARTGNPNSENSAPEWPAYNTVNQPYLVLETNSHAKLDVQYGVGKKHCRFWREISPRIHNNTDISGSEPCPVSVTVWVLVGNTSTSLGFHIIVFCISMFLVIPDAWEFLLYR
ncbi:cholinesterase-like [Glandiceps talaboti]